MSLFDAAERVVDTYLETDADRTICLCCLMSAKPGAHVAHRADCAIGALAAALVSDWQSRAAHPSPSTPVTA